MSEVLTLRLTAGDLAQLRFGVDALWELTLSLRAISGTRPDPRHVRLARSLPTPAPFNLPLLGMIARDITMSSSFIDARPAAHAETPSVRIAKLAASSQQNAQAYLDELGRRQPTSRLALADARALGMAVVSGIEGYWASVFAPMWERVEPVLGDDIGFRARCITAQGLGAVVNDLHPSVTWHNDVLEVRGVDLADDVTEGHRTLWLVPSAFTDWVHVTVTSTDLVLTYPARGSALIYEGPLPTTEPIAPLLGRSRAAILATLDVPRTTTSLAELLRLAPGTVSGHLSVLAAAGLVRARRDGRRVLYARCAVGSMLLGDLSPERLPHEAASA